MGSNLSVINDQPFGVYIEVRTVGGTFLVDNLGFPSDGGNPELAAVHVFTLDKVWYDLVFVGNGLRIIKDGVYLGSDITIYTSTLFPAQPNRMSRPYTIPTSPSAVGKVKTGDVVKNVVTSQVLGRYKRCGGNENDAIEIAFERLKRLLSPVLLHFPGRFSCSRAVANLWDLRSSLDLNLNEPFTVSAWVKRGEDPNGLYEGEWRCAFSIESAANRTKGSLVWVGLTLGNQAPFCVSLRTNPAEGYDFTIAARTVVPGFGGGAEWTHVALVLKSATLHLYHNGIPEIAQVVQPFGDFKDIEIVLGNELATANCGWDGQLANVRVVQRALTSAEIAAEMRSTRPL